MKFTRKQLSKFKKLHPEAVCSEIITEAQSLYERGKSFEYVCWWAKRVLKARQQLPWFVPTYRAEKYPKAEFKPGLGVDELLSDLDKYADLSRDIIDENRALFLQDGFGTENAEAYFRSTKFDFHQLVVNCERLLSDGVATWVDADLYREEIAELAGRDRCHLWASAGDDNDYQIELGQAFFTAVKPIAEKRHGVSLLGMMYKPRVDFEPFPDDLTTDELIRDIHKYSVIAEGIIEQRRSDLMAQRDDAEVIWYFKSTELDFHLQIVNCRNWMVDGDKRRWIRADDFRRELSVEMHQLPCFLGYMGIGSTYKGWLGMAFSRSVRKLMDKSSSKEHAQSTLKAVQK